MKKYPLSTFIFTGLMFLTACATSHTKISFAQAIETGNTKTINYYLKHHANVNQTDEARTPLIVLAAKQDASGELLAKLIEAGADVNAADAYGQTALMLACYYNHPDDIRQLVQANARVNQKDKMGNTALWYAVIGENTTIAHQLLTSYQANINAQNNQGVTPLMWVAQQKNLNRNLWNCLLEHHPDVNLQDKTGRTALILATIRGQNETVRLLLAAGADPSITDFKGKTALHYAQAYNYSALTNLLNKYTKKQPTAPTKKRYTAKKVAATEKPAPPKKSKVDWSAVAGWAYVAGKYWFTGELPQPAPEVPLP